MIGATPRAMAIRAAGLALVCGGLWGCSGHGRHTTEGLTMAEQRLSGFKAGSEWDMAQQQFLSGELDKALRSVDKSISLNDSVAKSHTLRARILMEMGRLEEAMEAARTARTIDPTFVEAHYYEGLLFERFSDYEEALASFAEAGALDPSDAQHAVAAAEMLMELGRLEEAQALLEDRRSRHTHNAGVRQTLGHLAMMRGDAARAADLFGEARLLAPEDPALAEDLARALIACERYSEAELTLSRLLERPSSATPGVKELASRREADDQGASRRDLEHMRVRCLIALQRSAEARTLLLGLTNGPEGAADAQAWIALGQVAHALKDLQRMRIAANRAIALAPDRPDGRMLLAAYRMETGDLEGALKAAHEAAARFPDDSSLRLLCGVILSELDRNDEAAQALSSALALDPKNERAAALLAAVEIAE